MRRLFDDHRVRKTTFLSGSWGFSFDENDIGEREGWTKSIPQKTNIMVPSVWNNDLAHLTYDGRGWYEKTFFCEGGTLNLVFEGVMTKADVWLDGEYLGNHVGAFSQFNFIVNDVAFGEHTLIVCADSRFDENSIPQKRVDWFNYGGIARDVSLEILKGISVLSNRVFYDLSKNLDTAEISCELELYNAENAKISDTVSVKIGDTVVYEGKVELEPYETKTINTPKFTLSEISLWSCETPTLYTVVAGTSTDDLIDKIGFRKIEAKDSKIFLNGEEIELRGVNRHEDHPEWGFAFPPRLMRRDLDLIKNMNCNIIRGSHYPNARIFVDMLDSEGILFYSEIPIWGGGFNEKVLAREAVVEKGLDMHREMLKYYFNHPSIIIWGMHNEIWTGHAGVYDITKKYSEYIHANGGNRLVTHATLCPMEDHTLEFDDIICINLYYGWYYGDKYAWDTFIKDFEKRRQEIGVDSKPVVFSEFGAAALYGWHEPFDSVKWSEEHQSDLIQHAIELFHRTPYVSGFIVWQFSDIRTSTTMDINRARYFNNKGIVNEYRKPKKSYFMLKDLYGRYKNENNSNKDDKAQG